MRRLVVTAGAVAATLALVLCAASPAPAITAELAKKCRDVAIKTHPPSPVGTIPYSRAEREFYRQCVAKNGVMPEGGSTSTPPTKVAVAWSEAASESAKGERSRKL